MRRTLGSVGAWLVATGIAILVAWLGVRSVQDAAVPDPEPLSAAEARKLAPKTPTPEADEPTETITAFPNPNASSKSPTATPTSAITPCSEEWRQVPEGNGGGAARRTFQVQGGRATISFSPEKVKATGTEPAGDFGVSFENLPGKSTVTVVVFTLPLQHISRIEASWKDDSPWVKCTERDA